MNETNQIVPEKLDSDELLTVAEVAGIVRLSPPRVYALIAEGRIPAVRLSERRIRIPRRALEGWLQVQGELAVRNLHRPEGS